jgi:hypothetical protein
MSTSAALHVSATRERLGRRRQHSEVPAPDGERSFWSHYGTIAVRPRRGFDALLRDRRCLRYGAFALLSNAALYTLVYVFLIFGGGRPTVFKPWLAIDPEVYYRWNALLAAPAMAMAWLLAASVAQLLSRAFGGHGTFENTLAVLGFGTAIASWCTLLHDLVTTFLGAVHVIDQRAYEDAMSSPTVFAAILWTLMAAYLTAFVALFSQGIASVHELRPRHAFVVGTTAFATYQLVFVIFNR